MGSPLGGTAHLLGVPVVVILGQILYTAAVPVEQGPDVQQRGVIPGRNVANAQAIDAEGFVKRAGRRLVVNGLPYFISGFNNYALVTRAADPMPGRYTRNVDTDGSLMAAQKLGMNALRTWAFADGNLWNALQPELGVYDERTFAEGLDYVVATAPQYGMRVILTLTNFHSAYGGMEQYVRWFNGSSIMDFYTNPDIVAAFKQYVRAVVTRVNARTGIPYSEDAAILAWDLANEPQAPGDDSGDILHDWVEDMAAYVKELDKNHLVTVGTHGYFGLSSPELMASNPSDINVFSSVHTGSIFAANPVCRGEDAMRLMRIPDIDMASLHFYPDFVTLCTSECKVDTADMFMADATLLLTELGKWVLCSPACHVKITQDILRVHIDAASSVGKPLFLGEFGSFRPVPDRNAIFRQVYNQLYNAAANDWAVAGSAMWILQASTMNDYDGFAVYDDPSMYGRYLNWTKFKPSVMDCQMNDGKAQNFRNHDDYLNCALRYVPNAVPPGQGQTSDPWSDGWEATLDIMRNSSLAFDGIRAAAAAAAGAAAGATMGSMEGLVEAQSKSVGFG